MKQQIVDRARGVVEGVLREPCGGAALDVTSVNPEVDGHGDEFLWIYLKYDNNPKGLPEPSAMLGLTDELRTELLGVDVEAFPWSRSSPTRKSNWTRGGTLAPEHLLQIATDLAEINTRRSRSDLGEEEYPATVMPC